MKFTIAAVTTLAATVSAYSVGIEARQLQCLQTECVAILQDLPCLITALGHLGTANADVLGDVVDCVHGETDDLCGCLECLPLVGTLIENLGVCPP
ncbi:hypothetical protein BX600DRAFT_554663 [Xylariales sp. PMI_506]|nr:hypothetical protein BX600DRAFT_554663 [Xylariales sp. PMI_506]